MKRVMIIGQPGSGKSTLAREIGARTGLPVVHVDQIYWLPGWAERPKDEQTALALEVHARPEWVFDGNMSRTFPDRLARADTFIWLDLPLPLRCWRVFKRTVLSYGKVRPDMGEGCPEQFSLEFWSFIWRTRQTGRRHGLAILKDPPSHLALHHLRSPADVLAFLRTLPEAPSTPIQAT